MKKQSSVIVPFVLTVLGALHAAKPGPAITDPASAAKDPDFAIQGEYATTAEIGKEVGGHGLQVVALGDGKFQAALYKGGLPGSGAESNEFVLLKGETEGDKTTFPRGPVNRCELQVRHTSYTCELHVQVIRTSYTYKLYV